MIYDYIGAVILIFFAEMGDKTQFLAMAFATKYPVKKIIIGVALGAFFNHGLAMLLGRILLRFISGDIINIVAGLMFFYFAFKSLELEDEELEDSKVKYGPVLTVAIAFFLGELGDKTQLAALGLSLSSDFMFVVLLGTVTGMVLTSLIGIYVGLKLGKKVPEDTMKIVAFLIFIVFGFQKIYRPLLGDFNTAYIVGAVMTIGAISIGTIIGFKKKYSVHAESSFLKQAERLKNTKERVELMVNSLCKGVENCQVCDGKACLVGYMKQVLKSSNQPINHLKSEHISQLKDKDFDQEDAKDIVDTLMAYYEKYPKEFIDNKPLVELRKVASFIVFKDNEKYFKRSEFKSFDQYKKYLDAL